MGVMEDNGARKPTYEELEQENARLRTEIERLLKRVEELERAPKRQAAPFSKGEPKKKPKKPGRKRGKKLFFKRAVPEQVDETFEATLPPCCPDCGGCLEETRVHDQYQTELPPVKPITRRFRVHVGRCQGCGKRVQGHHQLQSSDALGAASVQLGPRVLSLGTILNKAYGLSWGKVARFIGQAFKLEAARSTYCRAAVERLGRRAEPAYQQLVEDVREARVVNADETGWKVAGQKSWLWVFTTACTTVYHITKGRGGAEAEEILRTEFSGILGRDGWCAYWQYKQATHQSCLAHHFKRAKNILEVAQRGSARFAHGVIRTLKAALDLRDKRDEYSEHGFAVWRGRVIAQMDRLLAWEPSYPPNDKFVRHLRRERDHLFTFLFNPEVEATNWPAEQAIRPAVITRKMSGGNRSERGARAQSVLTSVLRTCVQRGKDAWRYLSGLLRPDDGDDLLLPGPSP